MTKISKMLNNTKIKFADGRWYYNRMGRYILLSRAVWELHNGPIPKGMVIHHIDQNKQNDVLSNLMMLTKAAHVKHHMQLDPEWQTKKRASMLGKNVGVKNGMYGKHADNPAAVKVVNVTTGEVFDCIIDGAKKYNCSPQNISKVCKGIRNLCGGQRWAYYER
jgi:hypothetical protein